MSTARFKPLDVMVTWVGKSTVGKSTTLNSIFQKEVLQVGNRVDSETTALDYYFKWYIYMIWHWKEEK